MSGISLWSEQERQEYSLTATRQALSVGFLFNVVMLERGCYLFAEHMACQTHHEIRFSRFIRRAQTGIECQPDMLSGDDKSYTQTSGMSL